MSDRTAIEWTDASWPVVAGCTRVSAGCENCWAIRHSHRLAGNPNPKVSSVYAGLTEYRHFGRDPDCDITELESRLDWSGEVRCLPERLDWPLRWKKPRRIFVSPMGDLFHERVPDSFIDQVFATMILVPQHTFQLLTKRPMRMRAYGLALASSARRANAIADAAERMAPLTVAASFCGATLRHVWWGISAEDQPTFDERVRELLRTPAALRFVNLEPLLGPADLRPERWGGLRSAISSSQDFMPRNGIDWVIAGSETGPGRRQTDIAWMRALRDQCVAARVPFFLKQLHVNGKKVSIPELDGKQWIEYPNTGRSPSG